MRKRLALAISLTLLLFASCKKTQEESSPALENTNLDSVYLSNDYLEPAFKAVKLLSGGELEEGMRVLDSLHTVYPTDPQMLFQKAVAFYLMGMRDSSQNCIRQCRDLYRKYRPKDTINRAMCDFLLGNVDEARKQAAEEDSTFLTLFSLTPEETMEEIVKNLKESDFTQY